MGEKLALFTTVVGATAVFNVPAFIAGGAAGGYVGYQTGSKGWNHISIAELPMHEKRPYPRRTLPDGTKALLAPDRGTDGKPIIKDGKVQLHYIYADEKEEKTITGQPAEAMKVADYQQESNDNMMQVFQNLQAKALKNPALKDAVDQMTKEYFGNKQRKFDFGNFVNDYGKLIAGGAGLLTFLASGGSLAGGVLAATVAALPWVADAVSSGEKTEKPADKNPNPKPEGQVKASPERGPVFERNIETQLGMAPSPTPVIKDKSQAATRGA